jgi:hypothetical protein
MAAKVGRQHTSIRERWQIHETTSRGLCQLGFLAFAVLPLLICLTFCSLQFIPAYQRLRAGWWEQWLAAKLGVDVSVVAFEAQAPEKFALHGVRLSNPETGASIGRVALVEVQRVGGQWGLRLNHPVLEERQVPQAWDIVHDWFLCRPQQYTQAARISMHELKIHSPDGDQELKDISIKLIPSSKALLVAMGFQWSDGRPQTSTSLSATNEPQSQLIIKRYHDVELPKTELQLRTGATPLPCMLAKGLIPHIERMGSEARFDGVLNLETRGEHWSGRITNGCFSSVDLGQLTWNSGTSITGTGRMTVEHAAFHDRGLELARGRIEVENGQIPSPLLVAACKHLEIGLRSMNTVSHYAFDRLGFFVDLRYSSINLAGGVEDAHGPLAARLESQWPQTLPLDRVIAVLDEGSPEQTAPAGNAANTIPESWLAKHAMLWLPLGPDQTSDSNPGFRLMSQSP